jgi:Carbohydrate binding module (family 35)
MRCSFSAGRSNLKSCEKRLRFREQSLSQKKQSRSNNMKINARESDLDRACRGGSSVFLALILTALALSPASAVQWTTNHFDPGRDGGNLNETILNPGPGSVNSTTFFGKLFDRDVDGEIYAEPLTMDFVTLNDGNGTTHEAVYVATTKNNVYCFDAEDPTQMAPLWSVNLGPPIPVGNVQCCCTDMSEWCGVTGTPVIDPSSGTMYLVTANFSSSGVYSNSLHALDISTGAEKFGGPKVISATVNGVTFDPQRNHQRIGLLLQGGNVYMGWSSHNDCTPYSGWIMGYNASTLAQVAAWPDTASGGMGGIWMSGDGLVGDGTSIYFTTGNGNFDLNTGGVQAGESFVRLNSTLVRQDYFTPYNQAALNGGDLDLGGGGIMLIPGTQRLVGGGKQGWWYLVNTTSMGGYNASANACIQSFDVTNPNQSLNHLHGGPVYFTNGTGKWAYTWGESDYCKAYAWNGTTFGTTPSSQSSFTDPLNSMPGGALTISANGTSNGILWADAVFTGNANHNVTPGILYAFDATNLNSVLWTSYQAQNRDDFGAFAKNPGPVVTNGKVYQATFSEHLAAYGRFPTPAGAIYQAENATLAGGAAFANNHNNYSGTGFVTFIPQGSTCTFTVSAPVAGAYALREHFANDGGATNTMSLFVNSTKIQQLTFPLVNNGNWDYWSDLTQQVTLNAGSNTISYQYTTSDSGNINLDYIELANFYEAENGSLSGGAAFANNHLGYSGTGFVTFIPQGSTDTLTVSVPVTGPYNVRLHYASGGLVGDRTISFYVNGSKIKQIVFPDLATWDYWADVTNTVTLNAGSNTIAYEFTASDTGNINLDYVQVESAPLRYEGESLTVAAHSSGDTVTLMSDSHLSGASGSQLNGAGVGSFVTYTVPVLEARTYDVKMRVKAWYNRGIVQLATAPSLTGTYTNWGSPVDLYNVNPTDTMMDLGQVTFGSAGASTVFRFTITGKNSASAGYDTALDYLLLIPN